VFTGIVELIGEVSSVDEQDSGLRLVVRAAGLGDLPPGASISVNGVCLTVVEAAVDEVTVDVIPETLLRTTLSDVVSGVRVNLERPMPANGRFDGHIVQGHIDGVGVVMSIVSDSGGTVMTIATPGSLRPYLVEKGSVTVDGVSLTVAGMTDDGFDVALIPHTLEVTTLGLLKPGDTVNLEVDVLAKYVERLLKVRE
jgi:riboflavin synthase